MKTIVLAGVMLAAPLLGTAAEPVEREVVPAEENAALRYWEAMCELAPHDLDTKRRLFEFGDLTIEEWNAELVRVQREIDSIIEASKMRRCDFGVPSDWAVGEYLPHLTIVRQGAQALFWDAERLAALGEFDQAAQRTVGIIRISEHLAQNVQGTDEAIISMAIFAYSCRFAAEFVDDFKDEQKAAITSAIQRFDRTDPFRSRPAILGQGTANLRWWEALRESPEFRADAQAEAARFIDEFGWRMKEWHDAMGDRQRMIDELDQAFRGYQRFCEKGAEVWDSPIADEELKRLLDDAENGQYGIVAAIAGSGVEGLRRQDRIANAQLAALRAWASSETETLELPEEEN